MFRLCSQFCTRPVGVGSFPRTTACAMCWTARTIADVDDTVVGTPATAQLHIHLTLNVHEYQTASEADRDDDQLRPERPFKHAGVNLFRRPVNEDVE